MATSATVVVLVVVDRIESGHYETIQEQPIA